MKNVLNWVWRVPFIIVKFFFVNFFWKSTRNGWNKIVFNYKMKICYQSDKFFEKYFNKFLKHSKKLGEIDKNDLVINYIEYYKYRISVLEKKYTPEAQLLVNSRRFLEWLKGQLPVDLNNLKKFKVLCSVKVFGHILSQLIAGGYIEAPYNSTTNTIHFLKSAMIAQKAFYIPQKTKNANKEISNDQLAKALSNSETPDAQLKKLNLPHWNSLKKSNNDASESI